MTPTTRPTIRHTASVSVSVGRRPGTATAIPGTSLMGIHTTAGSIRTRSGTPTPTPDITITGEGTHTMEGDTQRGDTAWLVRRADPGASMPHRPGVTRVRRCRQGAQERQGESYRPEDRLHVVLLSPARRHREDMQGQEFHRGVSRACGDHQRAPPPRGAARAGPAGGATPLPQVTRHHPVASAAGVGVAGEAEVQGAEAGAVVEAEAREVAAAGARQEPRQ